MSDPTLTPAQQALLEIWQQHTYAEFIAKDADAAIATMTDDAHVLLVPSLTGGTGKAQVREFYANYFIPNVPSDFQIVPISQTIGEDQLVDEGVAIFTHSIQMDWMLPGVPATGKRLELPTVGIIRFRDGKIAHEHLYWDQASVLVQLGLLEVGDLPIAGAEIAHKLLDPTLPLNKLLK